MDLQPVEGLVFADIGLPGKRHVGRGLHVLEGQAPQPAGQVLGLSGVLQLPPLGNAVQPVFPAVGLFLGYDDLGPVGLTDNGTADFLGGDVDDVADHPIVPRLAERNLTRGEPGLLFPAAPEIGAAPALAEQVGVEPPDEAGGHRLAGGILDLEAHGLRLLGIGLFDLEPLVARRIAGLRLQQLELGQADQRGLHLVEMDRVFRPVLHAPAGVGPDDREGRLVRPDRQLGRVVDTLGQNLERALFALGQRGQRRLVDHNQNRGYDGEQGEAGKSQERARLHRRISTRRTIVSPPTRRSAGGPCDCGRSGARSRTGRSIPAWPRCSES